MRMWFDKWGRFRLQYFEVVAENWWQYHLDINIFICMRLIFWHLIWPTVNLLELPGMHCESLQKAEIGWLAASLACPLYYWKESKGVTYNYGGWSHDSSIVYVSKAFEFFSNLHHAFPIPKGIQFNILWQFMQLNFKAALHFHKQRQRKCLQ